MYNLHNILHRIRGNPIHIYKCYRSARGLGKQMSRILKQFSTMLEEEEEEKKNLFR